MNPETVQKFEPLTSRGQAAQRAVDEAVKICTNCRRRPQGKHDGFDVRNGLEWATWCDICHGAAKIVFTSAEEGVKYGVRKENRREVLEEALKLEKKRHFRLTLMKAIETQLRRLARLPHFSAEDSR